MQLDAEFRENTLIIRVCESRLDAAAVLAFKEGMRELLTRPSSRVLLDLSQVEFLDSSGLGAVVSVMKLLAPDRQLELAGLTGPVQKVFHLTRMDTVFSVHSSVEQGLYGAG